MPVIKKIKKDAFEAVSEAFEQMTDEDVAESGIVLADDEILVIEKAQPVQPQNQGQPSELEAKLHKVNRESAARRIELRNATTTIQTLEDRNKTLESELSAFKLKETKDKAKDVFEAYVKEKSLVFVSDEAGRDIKDTVFGAVDWQKEVTKEILAPLVDDAVTKRPYVLKSVTLPPTGGGQRGSGDTLDIDLEAVAREFNLPFESKQEKE